MQSGECHVGVPVKGDDGGAKLGVGGFVGHDAGSCSWCGIYGRGGGGGWRLGGEVKEEGMETE